jgi:hypothetical protein
MYPSSGPYLPAPPPAPGTAARVRPSGWWFLAAAGIALAGWVAGAVIIVSTIVGWQDRIDGFDRVAVPGTMRVELRDTGGYSIYYEFLGVGEDGDFGDPTDDPAVRYAPDVTVQGPSGEPVPLAPYDSAVTYDTVEHSGQGLYTFEATEPGTYVVEVRGEPAFSDSTIAVGRGVGAGVAGGVVGGVLLGLLVTIAAGVAAIAIGVGRYRSRRRLLSTYPPTYGPPGYGPPGYSQLGPVPPGQGQPPQPGWPPPPPPGQGQVPSPGWPPPSTGRG